MTNSHLKGLSANTKYYFQLIVKTLNAEYKSTIDSFKTLSAGAYAIIYSETITDDGLDSTYIFTGTINSIGGSAIIETGFYYSLSQEAKTTGTKVVAAGTTSPFTYKIKWIGGPLQRNKDYYFVAYGKNRAGTCYAAERSFTTH